MHASKATCRMLVVLLSVTALWAQASTPAPIRAELGVSAALWLGGTMDGDWTNDSNDPEKNTGLLLHAFLDGYLMERFATGLYLNLAPIEWDNYDDGSFMTEFGFSLKPRFPLEGGVAIKPALEIGYRRMSSDLDVADDISALGLNLSLEVQLKATGEWRPHLLLGFLAQPVGGNDYDDWTFAPIFYLGAGITR